MEQFKDIDLNLLVSLAVLLETKNVTRAAEQLGLTQSSVSAQLARLRKAIGDPLLLPADSGRGMNTTSRAEQIAPYLKNMLADIEQLIINKPEFHPERDSKIFNIASSDSGVVDIGLSLVARVAEITDSKVQIAFHNYQQSHIAAQLSNGEIDLLIGSERMIPETMKAKKLYDEHFVMMQRRDHPRGNKPPTLEQYCQLQHVLVSIDGGSFYGFMDEQLNNVGSARQVVLSVQHFTLIPEILRSTNYVCTAPSRLATKFSRDIEALPLPFINNHPQQFAMYLAWHPRNHNDPALMWLRELIATVI